MRKLIESTLVSLDGVIESPDRWSPFDQEAAQLAMRDLDNYDAFVMGREAYDRLRTQWAPVTGNPYIEKINDMPKYVASRSLTEVTWNATLLGPDIVGAIERLKAQPGKDLIKFGTSRIDATLRRRISRRATAMDMPAWSGPANALFNEHRHSAAIHTRRRPQARRRLRHPTTCRANNTRLERTWCQPRAHPPAYGPDTVPVDGDSGSRCERSGTLDGARALPVAAGSCWTRLSRVTVRYGGRVATGVSVDGTVLGL